VSAETVYSTTSKHNILEMKAVNNAIASSSATTNIMTSNGSSTEKLDKTYVQVYGGCKWNFSGGCISVREGPGINYKKIYRLRNGLVLQASHKITKLNGEIWYKITFENEKINKPDRLKGDWYVSSKYLKVTTSNKTEIYDYRSTIIDENKRIYINLKSQTLEAYEGDKLYIKTKISTGLLDTPTEPGEYYIQYMTPSRYMQDNATNTNNLDATTTPKEYYDLPGVPFTMYFDSDGKAIHGAYWHNNFGKHSSHGCINLPILESEKLYNWSSSGMAVIIRIQ
jgi:lipoprotein-anchoring transpeptidase ErfK/SrfK